MKVFIDVSSSCTSVLNTGMQRISRKIFAELSRRTQVQPVCWNRIGNFYLHLDESELRYLTRPFDVRQYAMARPEWRGRDPISDIYRWIRRRRINLEEQVQAGDVFLVPDIYRDSRRMKLPHFLRQTPARTVAIFHDASDLRLASVYGDQTNKSRPYVESLALFDLVICVSEEARSDLHHFWKKYGCDPSATCVELWPGEFEGAVQRETEDGRSDIVLYVSSFHGRKNHLTLLRAVENLWSDGLDFELHLIGRSVGAPFNKIVRQILKLQMRGRRLRWLRHVSDRELLRAYRQCRFTVYPSLMEGFGLPIVESLAHGKPCICGGNGALGEVARGGGCLTVDQASEDAVAAGIKKLLKDRQMRERLSTEARARKVRSWSDYADKLVEHLQIGSRRAPTVALSNV